MNKQLQEYHKSISETQIVHSILEYLDTLGITAWRANTGAMRRTKKDGSDYYCKFGFPGMPDIIGYVKKTFGVIETIPMFIEVKKIGGKLSSNQKMFLDKAKKDGCIAMVAFSVDDVEKELEEFGLI
jgi:hypothetical protein